MAVNSLLSLDDIVVPLGPGHDVDLGANVGDVTADLLRLGALSVRAVEPLNANVEILRRRFDGDTRVTIDHRAVSCAAGRATFHVKPNGEPGHAGSAGSSLRADKQNVSREIAEVVDVVPLSSYLDGQVRVLKIDIEGSEYDAMDEAIRRGVLQNARVITFEDHLRKVPAIARLRNIVVPWLLANMPDRTYVHVGTGFLRLTDTEGLARYEWTPVGL